MALKTTNFTFTPSSNVNGYWVAIDDTDVPMNNDQGSVRLDDSQQHFLTWWFAGNPGETLGILGQVSGRTVVEIKQSTIPDGQIHGGGVKRFSLN